MFIDTVLTRRRSHCGSGSWLRSAPLAVFFAIDLAYFGSNLTKMPDGGWFPLLVGVDRLHPAHHLGAGRQLMIERMNEASMPLDVFIKSAAPHADPRVRARRSS